VGDVVVKRRLVVLHDQHVVRLLLLNEELREFRLRVHRIRRHDDTLEVLVSEQSRSFRDLVRLLSDFALRRHDSRSMDQRPEQVNLLPVLAASSQRLAVQGDRRAISSIERLIPGLERPVERVDIGMIQKIAESFFRRNIVSPRLRVLSAVEPLAFPLLESRRELSNRRISLRPGEGRTNRDRPDRQRRVQAAPSAPMIRNSNQHLHQLFGPAAIEL